MKQEVKDFMAHLSYKSITFAITNRSDDLPIPLYSEPLLGLDRSHDLGSRSAPNPLPICSRNLSETLTFDSNSTSDMKSEVLKIVCQELLAEFALESWLEYFQKINWDTIIRSQGLVHIWVSDLLNLTAKRGDRPVDPREDWSPPESGPRSPYTQTLSLA